MNYLKSLNSQSLTVLGAVLLAAVFMFVPDMAFAAGGLETVKETGKTVRTWLYAMLGIGGGIYLMIKVGKMWFDQRSDWGDLGMAVLKVAIGAGIPALMVWLWGEFSNGGTWN